MNEERARQIMNSLGVIEVLHQGSPVWIENIHGESAEVTQIKTKKKMDVPLETLMESTH